MAQIGWYYKRIHRGCSQALRRVDALRGGEALCSWADLSGHMRHGWIPVAELVLVKRGEVL